MRVFDNYLYGCNPWKRGFNAYIRMQDREFSTIQYIIKDFLSFKFSKAKLETYPRSSDPGMLVKA